MRLVTSTMQMPDEPSVDSASLRLSHVFFFLFAPLCIFPPRPRSHPGYLSASITQNFSPSPPRLVLLSELALRCYVSLFCRHVSSGPNNAAADPAIAHLLPMAFEIVLFTPPSDGGKIVGFKRARCFQLSGVAVSAPDWTSCSWVFLFEPRIVLLFFLF